VKLELEKQKLADARERPPTKDGIENAVYGRR